MAKAAAPVIAVLLKNFLRDIPVSTSFDNFIADSPHFNHVPHPADPADLSMEHKRNGSAWFRMPNYPTRLPIVKNNVTNM
jgi:hypothetical protein